MTTRPEEQMPLHRWWPSWPSRQRCSSHLLRRAVVGDVGIARQGDAVGLSRGRSIEATTIMLRSVAGDQGIAVNDGLGAGEVDTATVLVYRPIAPPDQGSPMSTSVAVLAATTALPVTFTTEDAA